MEGGEIIWREDDESNTPVLTMNEARSIFRDVVSGLDYRKLSPPLILVVFENSHLLYY